MNAVVNGKPGVIGATIGSRSQISAQTPPGQIAYTYYGVNGSPVGHEPGLNLIAGPNVSIAGVDNPGANRVDITVSGQAPPVASVFGRTGAVVAVSGDYSAAQVTNAVDKTQVYADPAWISSLSWAKISGVPATGVSSVFGRSGAVVAASGDYAAAQVTNAVDATQAYANPAWITSLDWSKIANAPALGLGSVTSVGLTMPAEFSVAGSPITSAGTFAVTKASQAANLVYASPSGAAGAPVFRALAAADFPAAVIGALQTPWLQNIIAAGFTLSGVGAITGQTALSLAASGNGNANLSAAGSGQIFLNTGGTNRLAIDRLGHFTIGASDDASAVLQFAGTAQTIQGTGGLNISAGVGTLNLNTNGLQRFSVDSTGQAYFGVSDSATGATVWLQGASTGASYVQGNGTVNLSSRQSNVNINANGTLYLNTGASSKTRLNIDSAGHVTINTPDDTSAALNISAAGGGASVTNFTGASSPRIQLVDTTSSGAAVIAIPSTAGAWLASSLAGDALFYNSKATAGVELGTNARARLLIDSAGHVTINAPDDAPGSDPSVFHLKLTGAGVQRIVGDAASLVMWAPNGQMLLGANTQWQVQTGATLKQRLVIDSAGHAIINAPDSGWNALYVGACVEAAPTQGFCLNLYNNGSGWLYRGNGAGMLMQADSVGGRIWIAPNGTAGAASSLNVMASFISGANPGIVFPYPVIMALPPSGSPSEAQLGNGSVVIAYGSNTQLIFRFKGTDGVIRQGIVTVA